MTAALIVTGVGLLVAGFSWGFWLMYRALEAMNLALLEADRDHRRQLDDLMQRIQAPEQAVMTHATRDAEVVYPVGFDDDDDANEVAKMRELHG